VHVIFSGYAIQDPGTDRFTFATTVPALSAGTEVYHIAVVGPTGGTFELRTEPIRLGEFYRFLRRPIGDSPMIVRARRICPRDLATKRPMAAESSHTT
jgi:hypothetical protein